MNTNVTNARSIESLAAESREVILRIGANDHLARPRYKAQEVFAAEGIGVWSLCWRSAMIDNDRAAMARLEGYLAKDAHLAMHHRPWQPEY